jgi:hypothetical protein
MVLKTPEARLWAGIEILKAKSLRYNRAQNIKREIKKYVTFSFLER